MKETEARKEQYENLDQKQKEELISVLIYSASIIQDEKNRTNEFAKIIQLAKLWNVNVEEKYGFTQKTDLSKINPGNIRKKIRIKSLMSIVADIASNFDFFDRQEGLEKELNIYKGMMQELGFLDDRLKEMTFGSKDYANQFLNNNLKRIEYLANSMYLANQIAHIIQVSPNQKDFIDVKNVGINLYVAFMRIKANCIKEAIKEKQKGANVRISIHSHTNTLTKDDFNSKYGDAIDIDIPGYLAPFSFHFDKSILSRQEILSCDSKSEYYIQGYRYNFPLKLTDEKIKLLEDLYNKKMLNGDDKSIRRLSWTIQLLKSDFTKDNKKKVITKPMQTTNRKYKGKELLKLKDNKKFLKIMQEKIGFEFPEYLLEGLLHRASYSFEEFANKIKPYVIEKLKEQGFKSRMADREFYKVFLHMRMFQNISILTRLPRESSTLKEKVDESIEKYAQTYSYLSEKSDKYTSYSELRRGAITLQKNENTQEIEDKKREEIDALLVKVREKKSQIAFLEKQLQEAKEEYSKLQSRAIRELGDIQKGKDNPNR